MTVATTTNRWAYNGDGVTVGFAYTNKIFADSDLKVYVDGTLKTLTTHYTVSGAGEDAGGTVTLLSAPAAGTGNVVIVRDVPNTQPSDFDPRKSLPPKSITDALDRLAIQIQQLKSLADRSLRLANDDTPATLDALPDAATRANLLLGFDADGNPVAAVESSKVSAAMAPVIAAATVAAARAALGSGATGDLLFLAATAAAARTILSLVPGTDVQAFDMDLLTIAGLAVTRGDLIYGDSSPAWNRKAIGAAGKALISDGADFAWAIPPYALENPIINGEFRIWQRGTSLSGIADDAYTADRWYILTQTGTIADARQSDPFDGARYSAQMTQSQASAQRIGRAQIIEGKNCKHLRGQAVTFCGRFKISNDQNVRVAILEWTGTEDSVTSDVVNDWTSGTYTAGNFFLGSNLAVSAVKQYASPGTGWVDFFVNATLSSSFNNLIVMIWTEGTAAQNVTFAQANCGLIRGSVPPTAHRPRPITEELALCQRFMQKTFPIDTAPAQNIGAGSGEQIFYPYGGAGGTLYLNVRLPVPMRAAPTVTGYNPAAANGEARNFIDAADCSGTALTARATDISIQTTLNAGWSANDGISIHWAAIAEL